MNNIIHDSDLIGDFNVQNSIIINCKITNMTEQKLKLINVGFYGCELKLCRDCFDSQVVNTVSSNSYNNVLVVDGKLLNLNYNRNLKIELV